MIFLEFGHKNQYDEHVLAAKNKPRKMHYGNQENSDFKTYLIPQDILIHTPQPHYLHLLPTKKFILISFTALRMRMKGELANSYLTKTSSQIDRDSTSLNIN